ncbi:MAG: hypothetical protein KJ044_16770, partial [Planctomycetes bacterium]|nr:hypothetical protein [Planctomycetota bacterium]
GFVALPDPTGDALDDMFSHNWFVNLELREGHAEMKKKLVDWMTGKALPKDADDWQKEEAKRRAEKTLFKKVDGGEILRERGLEGLTLFFGDNLVGMAGSEEIALRVLKANAGGGGLSPSVIPGGAVASKLLFIDLAELLARTQQQSARWETRERRFITPLIDVRKLLKGGLRLGVFSSETPTRLTFSASTSGENSLRPLLETLCGELEIERAWRHDEDMLQDLSNGLNSWLSQNEQSLKALPADKLKEALAAITPAKLMDAGFFSPQDGMRSAFDPALARRFAAMLESGGDELGGEGGPGDMKESGYDWFGLPATWPFGDDLDRGWGELRDIWMVCASKGNWMRNGRAAIVFSASALRVVWLEEADFKRIRQANAAGRRVAELPEAEPAELPRWKVKARLARQRWDTYAAQDYVRRAVEAAKAEGREFELRFDGSKEEDPLAKLRQLLGIGPDEWFHLENPRRLEIEAKGDKFRVRIKQGDLWIEMDQDGNITTSWDNE